MDLGSNSAEQSGSTPSPPEAPSFDSDIRYMVYAGLVRTCFALREGYYTTKARLLDGFDQWIDRKIKEGQAGVDELESRIANR